MKKLILFTFILFGFSANSQSLADASRLFENYEYAQAAALYEKISLKKKLSVEDYKRLAYSYYTIGDYDKCYPIVDSLVKIKEVDPFFHYAHGKVCMSRGEFTKAKSSFLVYGSQDKEFPVEVLVASCDSLLVWKPVELKGFGALSGNSSKADINGTSFSKGYFVFKETGIDSLGNELPVEAVDLSEVVFSKPFFVNSSGEMIKLALPDDHRYSAITSATILSSNGEVLLTVAQPLADDKKMRSQHLYIGKLDTVNKAILDLKPWMYSGLEDTTSCAHATINASGTKIIFTKLGLNTQQSDLYVSNKEGEMWSKPTALAELNTPYNDMFPFFTGDSLLSFATDGRAGYGSLDIYTTRTNGDSFGSLTHLKAPINSLKDDFNYTYVSDSLALYTSNRMGDKGDDDIYKVAFEVEKEVIEVDTLAEELDRFAKSWKDVRIYFEFADYTIKDFKKIDSLIFFLANSPGSSVIIEGHTDARGTEEYNQNLSFYRANAIKKELMNRGVSESQIKLVSKGKTEPQVNCEKGCTEEQHAMNRVALIKLVVGQ